MFFFSEEGVTVLLFFFGEGVGWGEGFLYIEKGEDDWVSLNNPIECMILRFKNL